MRKPQVYLGRPVRSLQTMLRQLSDQDSRILPLIPDGYYGPNTHASVRSFQEAYGLPVTGAVDLSTWRTIEEADRLNLPALRWEDDLLLAQAKLLALAAYYPALPSLTVSGVLDAPTRHGLQWVQKSAGLPETGGWDSSTAHALDGLYRTMPI